MSVQSDAGNRNRILQIVALVPGIHLREIERALGISLNTVRYHVKSLANSGIVSYSDTEGYFRLFPAGTTDEERAIYSILRSRTARKILAALNSTELTNKEVCKLTGLAKSTVSEHVQIFLEHHLVKINYSSDYGGSKIQLGDPDFAQHLLGNADKVKNIDIVENYVDLWDF